MGGNHSCVTSAAPLAGLPCGHVDLLTSNLFSPPSVTVPVSLPSPLPLIPRSRSPLPSQSLFTQSSHMSRGLPMSVSSLFVHRPSSTCYTCPAHCNRFLTSFLLKLSFPPTSSLSSSILPLSTLFIPTILLTQVFSQTWTSSCCFSIIAVVSRQTGVVVFPSSLWSLGRLV